ncbi:MAG: DUF971 domain-containing protein [Candidatus Omnitrophica bacterium]|nr:DUF971 domain-containing protein [Candidatus Omnitrophota bacterium]
MVQEETPIPSEITRANVHDVLVKWKDGHESLFPARELRLACPCAGCIDEMSGERRFDADTIPQEVHPLTISLVGRYAITIQWSDGHRTGIYAFTKLRKLCPCPKCRPQT